MKCLVPVTKVSDCIFKETIIISLLLYKSYLMIEYSSTIIYTYILSQLIIYIKLYTKVIDKTTLHNIYIVHFRLYISIKYLLEMKFVVMFFYSFWQNPIFHCFSLYIYTYIYIYIYIYYSHVVSFIFILDNLYMFVEVIHN